MLYVHIVYYIILVGFRRRILQGDRFPTLLRRKRSTIIVQILTPKYQSMYLIFLFRF